MIGNLCRLLLVLSVVACGAICSPAAAQQRRPFQGDWEWIVYPKSRKELPPAYRNEPIRSVPVASLYLKLFQRGNKLTGDYSASARYLAKLEEGEVDAVVKGKTARLELTSSFGGNLTVEVSLSGKFLHWKIIKSDDGQAYFPDDVSLHRVRPRKRIQFDQE
ncbi:MAG TPA: hypothetical protein VGO56_09165 [Pyrinomonadaceae bacterium]|jgi:hypothetical protein|nr:hypothetical protein [Pyrinomonadaceae bacterium]